MEMEEHKRLRKYSSFDTLEVEKHLKQIQMYENQEIQQIYIGVRRDKIKSQDMSKLCEILVDSTIGLKNKIGICRIMKQLTKNGAIQCSEALIQALMENNINKIQIQLAAIICEAFQLQKICKTADCDCIQKIKEIISSQSVCDKAIKTLNKTISFNERQNMFITGQGVNTENNKKNDKMYQRQVQQTKSYDRNVSTEEKEVNMSNFIQAALQQIRMSQQIQENDISNQLSSNNRQNPKSDLSFFNTTYKDIKVLYDKACYSYQSQIDFNSKDINEFLTKNFLEIKQYQSRYLQRNFIENLIVDRMIAFIFLKVSQQKIILEQKSINKLIDCFCELNQNVLFNKDGQSKEMSRQLLGNYEENNGIAQNLISKIRYFPENINLSENNLIYFLKYHEFDLLMPKRKQIFQLQEILQEEINKLRLDSIEAFIIQARLNQKIVPPNLIGKLEQLLKERSTCYSLKREVIQIITNYFQKNISKDIVNCMISNFRDDYDDQSIENILQQSKNQIESLRLFDKDIIIRIINLHTVLKNLNKRLKLCQIITNLLHHSLSFFSDQSAVNYSKILLTTYEANSENPNSDNNLILQIRYQIQMSLLYYTEQGFIYKQNINYPSSFLENLKQIYIKADDPGKNFVLLIYFNCRDSIIPISLFSDKILSNQVILRDNSNTITFQENSLALEQFTSISTIVCQIIYFQLQKSLQDIIDTNLIENLIKAQEVEDLQTKIWSAKCLYSLIVRQHKIEIDQILKLEKYIGYDHLEVQIYLIIAYLEALMISSQQNSDIPLLQCHMEKLSQNYCFDSFSFEVQDQNEISFTEQTTNTKILKILISESSKQKLPQNIFTLMGRILKEECKSDQTQSQVLFIIKNQLSHYQQQKFPSQIIKSFEHVIQNQSLSDQLMEIMEQLINDGNKVSYNISEQYINNLSSEQDDVRLKAFYILDQISRNQELPDNLFNIIELERASLSVIKGYEDQLLALEYIIEKTSEGEELSIGAFHGISNSKSNMQKVFEILLNAQNNKQVFPNLLALQILNNFQPEDTNKQQLKVITNILRTQQSIPDQFLKNLKKAIHNEAIFIQILEAFAIIANKINLDQEIVKIIGDTFVQTQNNEFQFVLLQAINSLMHLMPSLNYLILSKSLRHGLFSKNLDVEKQIVNIYLKHCKNEATKRKLLLKTKQLSSHYAYINILENECIECLLQKLNTSRPDMKGIIKIILGYQILNEYQKKKIEESALLDSDKEEDILKLFELYLQGNQGIDEFPERILDLFLTQNSSVHSKIVDILDQNIIKNFIKLPDRVIDALIDQILNTQSNDLIKSTCQIVSQIIQSGKQIKQEKIIQLSNLAENEDVLNLLNQIIKTQKQIPNQVNLILRISILNVSIASKQEINKIINYISKQVLKGMFLPNFCIKKLIDLEKHIKKVHTAGQQMTFVDVLAKLYLESSNNLENIKYSSSITRIIEQAIMEGQLSNSTIKCYYKIIQSQKLLFKRLRILEYVSKLFYISCQSYQNRNKTYKFQAKITFALYFQYQVIKRKENIMLFLNNLLQERSIFKGRFNKKLTNNIVLCIHATSDYIKLPNEIIDTFKENICESKIKNIVLSSLLKDANQIDITYDCQKQLKKLSENLKVDVKYDENLIEALYYSQNNKFALAVSKPQVEWPKKILIELICEYFKLDGESKNALYQQLLDLESAILRNQYQKQCFLGLLKNINQSLIFNYSDISISQFQEMIELMTMLDLNLVNDILLIEDKPYYQLRNTWVKTLLKQYFRDKSILVQKITLLSERILNINYLSLNMVKQMLTQLKRESIESFEDNLLHFLESHNIREFPLMKNYLSISDFINLIEFELLRNILKLFNDKIKKVENLIKELFDLKWNFNLLKPLIEKALQKLQGISVQQEEYLFDVLQMIINYSLPPNMYQEMIIVFDSDAHQWLKLANIVIFQKSNLFIPNGRVRDRAEIKKQYIENNKLNQNQEDQNLDILKEIQQSMDNQKQVDSKFESLVFGNIEKNINQWDENMIQKWAKEVLKNSQRYISSSQNKFIKEALLVANIAIQKIFSYELTEVQILACIAALNKSKENGRLLQIGTGEGKSNVISVIAAILALQKIKVDIVTSNSDLAKRDAQKQQKFYKLFGLRCADNIDRGQQLPKKKECYSYEIVYGDANSFQFDHLTDSDYQTYNNRECQFLLIDEVDCYLIDERNSIAKLSFYPAGIDLLNMIFSFIWSYLSEGEEKEENEQEIQQNIWNKFQDLKLYKVPQAYKQYVKDKFANFVSCAIIAKKACIQNVDYIIEEGKIKPVDCQNTGAILEFTHWQGGLHQFLQLLHSLRLSPETFTTNFISMDSFLKKYKENVIGFSATLGNEQIRQLIKREDKIDSLVIPLQYHSQLVHLPDFLCKDKQEWIESICKLAIKEGLKERGVLIVCQSIQDVNDVNQVLSERYSSHLIKCYKMNNRNEERAIQKIRKGEIFITTNLGGRGFDIKIEDIQQIGGMHTILTYLPLTERVEIQIIGRSARQGKCGTSQLVLLQDMHQDLQVIKQQRNQKEINCLQNSYSDLTQQVQKDKYMNEYRALIVEMKSLIMQEYQKKEFEIYLDPILNEIEFQWAFFLMQENDLSLNPNYENFEEFKSRIKSSFKNENFFKNNFYLIRAGNNAAFIKKVAKIYPFYDRAIMQDSTYSAAAYAGKGFIELKQKNQNKKVILECFKNARQKIRDEILLHFGVYQILQNNEKQNMSKEDLQYQQQKQKENLLNRYQESLHQNIRVLKHSLRLIDLKYQDQRGNKFYQYKNKDKVDLLEILSHSNGKNYSICFNSLTIYQDIGSKDQYIKTIKTVCRKFPNMITNVVFKKIEFKKVKDLFCKKNYVSYQQQSRDQAIKLLKKQKDCDGIDIQVCQNGQITNIENCKTLDTSLKLINDKYKENILSFNLRFITKQKQTNYESDKLKLNFLKLNKQIARNLILNITVKNLEFIEITEKAGKLIKELKKYSYDSRIYYFNQTGCFWEYLSISQISFILKKYEQNSQHSIKLEKFDKNPPDFIDKLEKDSTAFFNLQFRNVNEILQQITASDDQLVTASIQIKQEMVKDFIKQLREQKEVQFSLEFCHLNNAAQAQSIVQLADMKSEKIKINKECKLEDSFCEKFKPIHELNELRERGVEFIFEISEQAPLPWISLCIVGVLAISQLTLGFCFSYSNFGQVMIAEGIIDILILIRTVYTRQFSWKQYLLEKSTALLWSFVEIGCCKQFSKVKNLMKANKSFQIVTKFTPQIVSLIMELNMGELEQKIFQSIQSQVQKQFNESKSLHFIISKLYTLEKLRKISSVAEEVQKISNEITVNEVKSEFLNFNSSLLSCISNANEFTSPLQRILNLVNNLSKSIKIVLMRLEQRLSDKDKGEYSVASLIVKEKINSISAKNIVNKLKEQNILLQYSATNSKNTFEYLNPQCLENQSYSSDVNMQGLSSSQDLIETINLNQPLVLLKNAQFNTEDEQYKVKVIALCQQIIQNRVSILNDTQISEIVCPITQSISKIIITHIKDFLDLRGQHRELLEQSLNKADQICGQVQSIGQDAKKIAKLGQDLFMNTQVSHTIDQDNSQSIVRFELFQQFDFTIEYQKFKKVLSIMMITTLVIILLQLLIIFSLFFIALCAILYLKRNQIMKWQRSIIIQVNKQEIYKLLKPEIIIYVFLLTLIFFNIFYIMLQIIIVIYMLSLSYRDQDLIKKIESKISSGEELIETEWHINDRLKLRHNKINDYYYKVTQHLREEGSIFKKCFKTLVQFKDLRDEYLNYKQKNEGITNLQIIKNLCLEVLSQFCNSVYLKVYYFYDQRSQSKLRSLKEKELNCTLLEKEYQIELSKEQLEYNNSCRKYYQQKLLVLLSIFDFLTENLQLLYEQIVKYSIQLFQKFNKKITPISIIFCSILLTVKLNVIFLQLLIISTLISSFTKK